MGVYGLGVTPLRPIGVPPASTASPAQRPDAARLAAQRAFFAAALNPPTGPTAAAQTPAAAPAIRAERIPDPAAPPPAKVLRPGSLLDIKV